MAYHATRLGGVDVMADSWAPNPLAEAFSRAYVSGRQNKTVLDRQKLADDADLQRAREGDVASLQRLREKFGLEREQKDYEAGQQGKALMTMLRGRPDLASSLGFPVKPGQPAVPESVGPEREIEAGTVTQRRPATTEDWDQARQGGSATGMARDTVTESYPRRSPITTAPITPGQPATAPEVQGVSPDTLRGVAPFLREVLHSRLTAENQEQLAQTKADTATRQKLEMGGRFADQLDQQIADNPNLPAAYRDQAKMLSGMARAGQIDVKDAAALMNPVNRFVMEQMQGGGPAGATGQGRRETTTSLGPSGATISQKDLADTPSHDMNIRQEAIDDLQKGGNQAPSEADIARRSNQIRKRDLGENKAITINTQHGLEGGRAVREAEKRNYVMPDGTQIKGIHTLGDLQNAEDSGAVLKINPKDYERIQYARQLKQPFMQVMDAIERISTVAGASGIDPNLTIPAIIQRLQQQGKAALASGVSYDAASFDLLAKHGAAIYRVQTGAAPRSEKLVDQAIAQMPNKADPLSVLTAKMDELVGSLGSAVVDPYPDLRTGLEEVVDRYRTDLRPKMMKMTGPPQAAPGSIQQPTLSDAARRLIEKFR